MSDYDVIREALNDYNLHGVHEDMCASTYDANRDRRDESCNCSVRLRDDAVAALSRVETELAETKVWLRRSESQTTATEARVTELEAERNEAIKSVTYYSERTQIAEAAFSRYRDENLELEAALREIADYGYEADGTADIARAALAAPTKEEG